MGMTAISWIRAIVAVVVGYLIASLANSAWVMSWYVNAEPEVTAALVVMTVAMFALSGFVAGFVLGKIAGAPAGSAGLVTAALLAVAGVANLLLGMSFEPTWHVLAAIFVQAPAAAIGARLASPGRN